MLEIVRIPRAVPIRPDTAALKAVLVTVRMLVAISARKLAASNIFNLGRHLVPANHYRDLSVRAFTEWGGGFLRIEFRL